MQPLEAVQLLLLNPHELASRIDGFFQEDRVSRFGNNLPTFGEVSAADMLSTKAMSTRPESSQKRALLLFYRARFQSALCLQYAGVENRLVHGIEQTDDKWSVIPPEFSRS